jgi:polyhydroxyalkanoate synthase
MVYAPINRYHILDLTPDRSIVNQFVSGDFDVFLLDWGEQKKNKSTITDYINYIDDYIEYIKKITNSDKINLFGYSWGGVLSMVYTSLYNDKKNIRNLIVQSSQADFDKDNTTIAEWMRSFPADEYVEEFGEMHGHVIDLAFLMRNPMIRRFDNVKFALDMQRKKDGDAGDNIQNNHYLISLTRLVRDLFRVSVWLNNTPDIQGEFFREFAKKMYQQNLLIKGQMTLGRNDMNNNTTPITKTINLKDITVPLLNIVGTEDDLVGPTSSIPLNDAVSSTDKKLIQFPLGHVELCISSYSHDNLWPEVVKWLQERCL